MEDKYFKYDSYYIHKKLDELTIIGLSDTTQTLVRAEREPRTFTNLQQQWIAMAAGTERLVEIRSLSNALNMEVLIVPSHIRRIVKFACKGLPKLKKVVIEGSDTVVEDNAFSNCPMLETVDIPDESLKYYPAFKGSPAFDSLIARYRDYINKKKIVDYDDCPMGSDFDEAFKGCDNIEYVNLRSKEHKMNLGGGITTMLTRVRNLDMAFFNCTSLKAAIIPERVDNMNGAFMGCGNLTEIAFLGHYKKDDVFGVQYTAENLESLIMFSPEPMLIGSTPNAVWYVPQESIEAYKQAVEHFNNTDGLLQGYIYYSDIKPLQEANRFVISEEIYQLLEDRGYGPRMTWTWIPEEIDAMIEDEVRRVKRRNAKK